MTTSLFEPDAARQAARVIESNYIWRADVEEQPGRRAEVALLLAGSVLVAYLSAQTENREPIAVRTDGVRGLVKLEVLAAPARSSIALEVVRCAAEGALRVVGDRVHVAPGHPTEAVYEVTGWDPTRAELIVRRVGPALVGVDVGDDPGPGGT